MRKLSEKELEQVINRKAERYTVEHLFVLGLSTTFALVTSAGMWFIIWDALKGVVAPDNFKLFCQVAGTAGAFLVGMAATMLAKPLGRTDETSLAKTTLTLCIALAMLVDGFLQFQTVTLFTNWLNIEGIGFWSITTPIAAFQLLTFWARSGMHASQRDEQDLIDAANLQYQENMARREEARVRQEAIIAEEKAEKARGRRRAMSGKPPAETGEAYMHAYNGVVQAEQQYAAQH